MLNKVFASRFANFCMISTTLVSLNALSEPIFTENFDSQADWKSAFGSKGKVLYQSTSSSVPPGWHAIRQGEFLFAPSWQPANFQANSEHHEGLEILSTNQELAYGREGKSLVLHRESRNVAADWTSDSILAQYYETGMNEVYVEFDISWDEGWGVIPGEWHAKIFRILHSDSSEEIFQNFGAGDNGPIFIWNHQVNDYGYRNTLNLRGDSYTSSDATDYYRFVDGDINDLPRQLSQGMSLNFGQDRVGMDGEGITKGYSTSNLVSKVTGEKFSESDYLKVTHKDVFGESGTWTRLAFFVRMNTVLHSNTPEDIGLCPNGTAPITKYEVNIGGTTSYKASCSDGVLAQWIDGQRIFFNDSIPWTRYNPNVLDVKWNVVSFGGNDFFHMYGDDSQVQEWYSIDNIKIYDQFPGVVSRPSPPETFITN